jgi:CHAD domain-containing protein
VVGGSDVLKDSGPSADVIVADVLDQFARNFLLNELSVEQSAKLLEATRANVVFQVARREPRRRNGVVGRVHQARGGIRRLRSVLQTFPGLFDPEWSGPMLAELSWFGSVLGDNRDWDVLRSGISKSLWLVEDEKLQSRIIEHLDRQIEAAQERSGVERSTKRYALLVDDIARIGTSVVFDPRAKEPAAEVLPKQLKGAWRGVMKAADEARAESNNENLHELRKELKRLQCACELLGLIEGKPALKLAMAAESTQSKLGVVHDEAVAKAWLKTLVVAEPDTKEPLKEIRAFHKAARRDAKRGWRDSLDDVKAHWSDFQS